MFIREIVELTGRQVGKTQFDVAPGNCPAFGADPVRETANQFAKIYLRSVWQQASDTQESDSDPRWPVLRCPEFRHSRFWRVAGHA